ncbi:MAG: hypothetical protein K0M45_08205 [Candidatus Paracaedibacteraceae bacterium]|nr:hypothetical protein [Candidatus Paracaedibacteraceae bacterium]
MTSSKLIVESFNPAPVIKGDTLVIACPIMIHNYGLPYYLEGFKQLAEHYPSFNLKLAIPCLDNIGLALKALEAGIKFIYFAPHAPAWPQLLTITACYGAELISQEDLNG